MKVFITGGTGFIGKHVTNKLAEEGFDLLLLSQNPNFILPAKAKTVTGDLASIEKWIKEVKDFSPDAVLHMAWEGIPDYSYTMSVKNLNYGLSLLDAIAGIGCKYFLSTGSCWEYGKQTGRLDEETPIKPLNAFTASKNALHWLGRETAKEYLMQFVWTRFFYVYGPGQKETSLIPYLINCVKAGKNPEAKNPFAQNDFIYVEDVAEAIYKIIKNCKESGVYNIGSGYLTSVQDIVKNIFDAFGSSEKYKVVKPGPTDVFSGFYADISKIIKETGWEPKTGIKEGIQKTIDYYKSSKN